MIHMVQPVIRLMKPGMQVKNLNCVCPEMGTGNYSVLDMDWDRLRKDLSAICMKSAVNLRKYCLRNVNYLLKNLS